MTASKTVYAVLMCGKEWNPWEAYGDCLLHRTRRQAIESIVSRYTSRLFKHHTFDTQEVVRAIVEIKGSYPPEPLACSYDWILKVKLPSNMHLTFPKAYDNDNVPVGKYSRDDDIPTDDPEPEKIKWNHIYVVKISTELWDEVDEECGVAIAYATKTDAINAILERCTTDRAGVLASLTEHWDYPHDRDLEDSSDDSNDYDEGIGRTHYRIIPISFTDIQVNIINK